MGYSIVITLAGIELPQNVTLKLDYGAVVVTNPITLDQGDALPKGPNATLFHQPRLSDGSFKEVARFLLGFQLDENLQANNKAIIIAGEAFALPLRLMTKGSITVSPAVISKRPLREILVQGCESKALLTQRLHIIVSLSEGDCAEIQRNLPFLRPPVDWQVVIDKYTEAYYKQDVVEQSLAFLVALETLVTPSSRSRDRSSKAQRYAALLASTGQSEQRCYRKLLKDAYKCRQDIWHGEADPALVAASKKWLSEHWEYLRDISRLSLQRALWLRANDKVSSLSDIAKFIDTQRSNAIEIWDIPVWTIGSLSKLWIPSFSDFEVEATGGASVSFNV